MLCTLVIYCISLLKKSMDYKYFINMEQSQTLTYTNPPLSILYTYNTQWFRVVRDTYTYLFIFMSLTVPGLLSDSHIPSLRHRSIVIPLSEGRGIRSCMTELLSDIRAVQMDDPRTLAWPTDKKSSLFVQPSPLLLLFLPYPSLKAQLQSFVTPWQKKKVFSQDSLQGHILQPFLGLPEGTGSLVVLSHQERPTAVLLLFVLR